MLVKKCEYCGKEFEPSTSSQKYCSRACRERENHTRKVEKNKGVMHDYKG